MNDSPVGGQRLLPIFRTPAQGAILAALLLEPGREANIAELAHVAGVAPPNALREVNLLVQAGVLRDRRVGRSRLVSADPGSPFVEPLAQILRRTHGPVLAVREAFATVPDVDRVLVVGSWAARALGHPGHAPRDLDLVVVGHPPTRLLRRVNAQLEEALGLPVQITVLKPDEWREARTGFVTSVRERPALTAVDRTEEKESA
ncbi:winged helix-turn-helix domain-containing protein [Cellulomonas sp. ES6]|uniref:winged helix-turn-helix domain-containing protein n=1 Tax=Cellulomonas sp. ES6 TaxID=3039384 RepID=UPI0024B8397F|nr:winged helix-turn-helix domain-containing protein [Cellulomonas sp. ES6]WHP16847.1 winged helix-turn-helix domain-containing protein [Cellulomonas sp. ES6]